MLVHISAQGQVLGVQVLPTQQERELPSNAGGAVERLVCPAREDCWMATYNGWLYHLAPSGERSLPRSELPGFPEGQVITERPHDEGVPQEVVDAPPPDTSGLREEQQELGSVPGTKGAEEAKVTLPLVSHVHSRLIKGSVLQLSFHLAVKARVQLIAKRGKKVIAHTANRVLGRGNHTLELHLNPRHWPTKLALSTEALAPLPVVSSVTGEGANITTESTGLAVLPGTPAFGDPGRLR